MLINVDNIKVYRGSIEALKGVSMQVEEGAITGVIGANGAGKSTLLRALAGLSPIVSGGIYFSNERIDRESPQQIARRGIAMVPEGKGLFPQLTVLENLKMGAFLLKDKDEAERKFQEFYRRFPMLKNRRKQQAGDLSGGEQQIVSIARALISVPRVMLMDEPSLGLAPAIVKEVVNIVLEINKGGTSVILVEQNAHMVFGIAKTIYVFETGQIAFSGPTEEVQQSKYVKEAYLGG